MKGLVVLQNSTSFLAPGNWPRPDANRAHFTGKLAVDTGTHSWHLSRSRNLWSSGPKPWTQSSASWDDLVWLPWFNLADLQEVLTEGERVGTLLPLLLQDMAFLMLLTGFCAGGQQMWPIFNLFRARHWKLQNWDLPGGSLQHQVTVTWNS